MEGRRRTYNPHHHSPHLEFFWLGRPMRWGFWPLNAGKAFDLGPIRIIWGR